jgi:hypothetical protein
MAKLTPKLWANRIKSGITHCYKTRREMSPNLR